ALAVLRAPTRSNSEEAAFYFSSLLKPCNDALRVGGEGDGAAARRLAPADCRARGHQPDELAAADLHVPAAAAEGEARVGREQDGVDVHRNLVLRVAARGGCPALDVAHEPPGSAGAAGAKAGCARVGERHANLPFPDVAAVAEFQFRKRPKPLIQEAK